MIDILKVVLINYSLKNNKIWLIIFTKLTKLYKMMLVYHIKSFLLKSLLRFNTILKL